MWSKYDLVVETFNGFVASFKLLLKYGDFALSTFILVFKMRNLVEVTLNKSISLYIDRNGECRFSTISGFGSENFGHFIKVVSCCIEAVVFVELGGVGKETIRASISGFFELWGTANEISSTRN
jgi:hypothetical protein